MAQAGFTPIQLYFSTTAAAVPLAANLAQGELAINITDGKLYYENNSGTVTLLASAAGASGDVVGPASATNNALARFDGTTGKLIKDSSGLTFDGSALSVSGTANNAVSVTSTATTTALKLDNTNANGWGSNLAIFTGGTAAGYFGTIGSLLGNTTQDLAVYANASNGFRVYTNGNNLRATFDSSGNLGLGVAPSAWSGAKAFQIDGGSMLSFGVGALEFWQNVYYNGTNTIYQNTAPASTYVQTLGQHRWFNAPSGTAGTNATMTQAMTLTATGNLGVGVTSPATPLHVNGVGTFGSAVASDTQLRLGPLDASNTYFQAISTDGTTAKGYVFYVGSSTGMVLNSSGNLGLGVSPSAWVANSRALQIGSYTAVYEATGGDSNFSSNTYLSAAGVNRAIATAGASRYQADFGAHRWLTAASVTAGNVQTFTTAMTLDASGNLGLGTTSPSSYGKFAVSSLGTPTTAYASILSGAGTYNGGFESTFYVGAARTDIVDNGVVVGWRLKTLNANASSGTYLSFESANSATGAFAPPTTYTERVRITSGGDMEFKNTGGTSISFIGVSGTAAQFGNRANDSMIFYTNNTAKARIDATGNMGLGVTPSAWNFGGRILQVTDSGGIASSGPNANYFTNVYFDGSNYRYIQNGAATLYGIGSGAYLWFTASSGTAGNVATFTQPMTLDSSGNLLVGTTSLEGSAKIVTVSSTNGVSARTTAAANNYEAIIASRTSTVGKAITLWYDLNLGIQAGFINIDSTSTVSLNNTSDYRAKENIQPLVGSIDRVKNLKPVSFNFKADGYFAEGFIAHEFAEVIPQAVHGEKDAVDENGKPVYQAIDQSKIVPLLTAAIQEQQAIIESLKARLDAANL